MSLTCLTAAGRIAVLVSANRINVSLPLTVNIWLAKTMKYVSCHLQAFCGLSHAPLNSGSKQMLPCLF